MAITLLHSPTIDQNGNTGSQISPVRPHGIEVPDNLWEDDAPPFGVELKPQTRDDWLKAAYPGPTDGTPEDQAHLLAAQNYNRKRSKEIQEQWEAEERADAYQPAGTTLDAFLGEVEPPPDWIVPGLLERQDRIIVTGLEGSGKSVLSRQVAVCAASGIHPFELGLLGVSPMKVMFVDLENPESEIRRSLRTCAAAAGARLDPANLTIVSRPDGMDLVGNNGAELRKELAQAGPIDLLIIGPLYKMVTHGDVVEEPVARELTATLDRIRIEFQFALWIEAHAPHQTVASLKDPAKLTTRPYGASLFKRWPEFGYFLHYDPETGEAGMRRWRQDRREGRRWPWQLRRGGKWPWTAPSSEEDLIWQPIQDAAEKWASENRGELPSLRKMEEVVGMSKSGLDRLIGPRGHLRSRWDDLKAAMRERYGPPPQVSKGQMELSQQDQHLSQQDQKGESA